MMDSNQMNQNTPTQKQSQSKFFDTRDFVSLIILGFVAILILALMFL